MSGDPRNVSESVKSLTRALDLLCCFSPSRLEWGVTEIAEYLGFSKSVAHRFLTTLETAGFVERTAHHRYRLGIRVLELGTTFRFQHNLLWSTDYALHALSREAGAKAHLAQLEGREVLELMQSDVSFSKPRQLSLRMPVHCTALGKVLLAFAGDGAFERFIGVKKQLKRFTPRTITSPSHFQEHLEIVRSRGYALDDEESKPGARCVGVPVRNSSGNVIAAISLSSTVERFTDEAIDVHLPRMQRTATFVSRALMDADEPPGGITHGGSKRAGVPARRQ